ncbi:M24 family metallopeptidase [Trichloromonas sp.]|uniref:M24 family metallopeptidase n=1 Tax=Trichloromonas sp. TaxID=3069249 RepID=UPI003D813B7D
MVNKRISQADELLKACALDAFVFFHLPNIRYLSGFSGTDGALVVVRGEAGFLTDSRYTTQARQQVAADTIREYRVKVDGVLEFLAEKGAVRVGFEAETLSFATASELSAKGSAYEWVPVVREIKSLRCLKDESEIDALERAAALNAECFEEILAEIRPGARERDVALALEFALKRRGAEEKAFDFIVASGVRGALPHGVASSKIIAAGELVTIDLGCRLNGYHSDETVTLAVGDISPRLRELHDVVLEAHDRAIDRVRPGAALRDIDAAARQFISDRGFGDYFGHGTGHGLGLEVHEFPAVSTRSEEEAREGMVFTIEPGIYIPDVGGVRIEDTVLVTAGGCRRLTRIPKGFRTLPV